MTQPVAQPRFGTLLVIGLGLIGGSFAAAIRQAGVCQQVLACDRNAQSLRIAKARGIIDDFRDQLSEAVAEADIIMLAVPILSMESVLLELSHFDLEGKIITDAGSSKRSLLEAAEVAFGEIPPNLVPGHPIAGSEKSGVEAAQADLFVGHKVLVTPHAMIDHEALAVVKALWLATGSEVLEMDVQRHDEVLAVTSHLPHLLAFSLVDTLATERDNQEIFRYAAGGFRDFTRIAASDPTMWHDIFIANKDAVLRALRDFTLDLDKLRAAIEAENGQYMLGVFTRAKVARDHFTKMQSRKAYMEPMTQQDICFVARPGGSVRGEIRVPGDKSISHRSIMLGSLAEGVTEVEGFLEGEDSLATLQAFRDMGVVIEGPHQGKVTIYGVGMQGLKAAPGPLYLGNSGTAMRLFCGLLAGQEFDSTLTGDESLSSRPMGRVANPLAQMGAVIQTQSEGRPPLKIQGGSALKGIDYPMPMASAQVKSCLLLAGMYAEGETSVTEPAPTRDHTERMLGGFGYPVRVEGNRVSIQGGGKLQGCHIEVPSDISSAAFFMVAASIAPDSDLLITHVGINPTRIGVINILRQMGADLSLENERVVGGEPVADVRVRSAQLKGIEIPEDQVPLAIDEFPVLFVAAACAEGRTLLKGAEELRVKESDRIQVMADGLEALGVSLKTRPDGIEIEGGPMSGGEVDSHGDHRIGMAFSVAALRASGEIRIRDCANVATSFPNFVELAQSVGFHLQTEE
ncbi:bifunctional prephenate dehydrogenase/3-phosphoshikimate 1-carboxyvinyltransferase [Aestuariirhabdus litorea]|uniref:3-phosphoshikimate 1-carboxyvinyltransferase n=1 Tax=Aestuariirhabdus litorea TaxID=2528527 RepID=A0A3P3VPD9_9GAMM|nr:bifunctional prephenate dehydrogenase/3-phosphoshikimate 1-carboxyvinyltransferase [Aestuariirhabdus litorea]RRJ84227.1 bifunctional prephenate dehydrogenase/3-phosphoshikimate 1-carboxyvinyltransferase [Aestuariirhabdus litorea]RWW97449.1 bifunctional prephenate dehydrogenase/3-phosphoshikimate 1-carboxyvinyltransferase [Endozoicomonadaceae bacterium GTF-13]